MSFQHFYDDLGNYVGPDLGIDSSDTEGSELEDAGVHDAETSQNGGPVVAEEVPKAATAALAIARAVEPHELKEYYPRAEDVYGPDTEVVVQEEDTQPITEPIIAPMKQNNFDLLERITPITTFSPEFLSEMMLVPTLIRQFSIVGHFHHGKTLLTDMLVRQTHKFQKPIGKVLDAEGNMVSAAMTGPQRTTLKARMQEARTRDLKYTDTRMDEQERNIGIKATPLSLILPDSRGKSYLCHVFDTPGHVNFLDEACAAMRISDGVVLVVDALEGVMLGTRKLLERIVKENLSFILVINCIDRLILELRIPPVDAYFKLRQIVEEVNDVVEEICQSIGKENSRRVSPRFDNVCFASADLGFIFTCQSFAQLYVDRSVKAQGRNRNQLMPNTDVPTLARLLWGDLWFNSKTGKFCRWPPPRRVEEDEEGNAMPDKPITRSFVHFILEPLYKLVAHGVAEERPTLEPTLAELGIYLDDDDYLLDTHSILRRICGLTFGDVRCLVDAVVKHVPDPVQSAPGKIADFYTGNQATELAEGMRQCDPKARLMFYSTKNYHRPDSPAFDVFGRVMSGTLKKGAQVKVLGQAYSPSDDEDMLVRDVSHLWIYEGRYRIEVNSVPAGSWCAIAGVEMSVKKVSTITSMSVPGREPGDDDDVEIFAPLAFTTSSVIKVACEPMVPSELPKMLEGLAKIEKSYPLLQTKVEESGEHVILGTGELYLDCALHDLRELYGNVEVKVSDPSVQFCETVVETSAIKAFAKTPNGKNKISMTCESLETGVAASIESGLLRSDQASKEIAKILTEKFEWDRLSSQSVWAFGPSNNGPNVLLNDVLDVASRKSVNAVRHFVSVGFQWATREGPLIEEAVRNTKFKLIDCTLATEPIHRGGGQIMPTARRVAYSSFLLATPRLMEPMLFAEIQCSADVVQPVFQVLERRRGHVVKEIPKPGTPFVTVHAYLPAIDSFGLEVDVRTFTANQAFILSTFDHWALVPGDPLDNSITLRPLEPAPAPHLAREFLLKTRRRKGLTEDVSIQKFFDEEMLAGLAEQD